MLTKVLRTVTMKSVSGMMNRVWSGNIQARRCSIYIWVCNVYNSLVKHVLHITILIKYYKPTKYDARVVLNSPRSGEYRSGNNPHSAEHVARRSLSLLAFRPKWLALDVDRLYFSTNNMYYREIPSPGGFW